MEMKHSGRLYRVIREHKKSYEDPISLCVGDAVVILLDDPEWPGWVWCVNDSGKSGWVPEEILQWQDRNAGIALRNYDAMELTVHVSEEVTGFEALAGWVWCRNANNEAGWVPQADLIEQSAQK